MRANTHRRDPRTPRGRPFRQIRTNPGVLAASERVAWLIRVNRLLGGNPDWVRAATFAKAFRSPHFPGGVSESTISRWEGGAARLSYVAVRRYEELLGLPRAQLTTIADSIYRYAAPGITIEPVLSRPPPPEPGTPEFARVEALFDRALSDAPVGGAEWDELTGYVAAMPSMVLVPSRGWTEIAGRLLEEMIVADGIAWSQRFESLNRLLAHPVAAPAAIAASVNLIRDPANQIFIEPVSVLDASSHPDAAAFVLDQLTQPMNERTRYGALLASVRKVRYGHFRPDQLTTLTTAISELLGEAGGGHHGAAALGVEVVRRLPAPLRADLDPRLRRALAADKTLTEVMVAGRLAASATSGVVVERIVRAAEAGLAAQAPGFVDDLLPVLVDEMLYAPVLDVRLNASMLVRATPYAPVIAAAAAAELARPHVLADTMLATSLLWVLRVLGEAEQRPLVERLVLATGVPADVSIAAVESVAHIGGASTDRFWLNAIALHGRGWRRHRARSSATALTGLVYGLGIAGNMRLLRQVREDRSVPEPVRAAAAWWLARSRRVFASVGSLRPPITDTYG